MVFTIITLVWSLIKYLSESKPWQYRRSICDATDIQTEIFIVEDASMCNQFVNRLYQKMGKFRVVGLDCEWVCQSKRHPISLLQLATVDGTCVLFKMTKFSKIPSILVNFLQDSSVIKVGFGISVDVQFLQTDYNITTLSFVDIDKAARSIGFTGGTLKEMSLEYLNVTLDKCKTIQCSDWETNVLSESQIRYAALDALMPVRIVVRILEMKISKKRLYDSEAWNCFLFLWSSIINQEHTYKAPKNKINSSGPIKKVNHEKLEKALCIKKPLYENCILQDQNGRVLCWASNKKLNWYIDKGLGTEIAKSPRTVKLNFVPDDYNRDGDAVYYTIEKENKCVVCGRNEFLKRKNIVPREYRKYFPKPYKDYKSYDVVLLCIQCHMQSVQCDQSLRHKLMIVCSAPVVQNSLKEEARLVNKLKYAANALIKNSDRISSDRRNELLEIIRSHENCDIVTESVLQDVVSRKVPVEPHVKSHGEKVVDHFHAKRSIVELEELWRSHFVKTMKPQFLPLLWSVRRGCDHDERVARSYIE